MTFNVQFVLDSSDDIFQSSIISRLLTLDDQCPCSCNAIKNVSTSSIQVANNILTVQVSLKILDGDPASGLHGREDVLLDAHAAVADPLVGPLGGGDDDGVLGAEEFHAAPVLSTRIKLKCETF